MLIGLRNSMLGKRLPYDAEVTYLESTGTQWIDTGVNISGQDSLTVETTVQMVASTTRQLMGYNASGATYWGVSTTGVYEFGGSNTSVAIGGKDKVLYNLAWPNGTWTVQLYINDALQGTKTRTSTISGTWNLWKIGGYDSYKCRGRIFACKIWHNGVLVRDFIPVRVGDVGYMYDKVSGRLFGNAGTGAFTIGPDKAT